MRLLSMVFCAIVLILAGATTLPAAVVVESTFDTDLDNWTKAPGADASSALNWQSTGGNPDGYLLYDEGATGGSDALIAPTKFLGDKSIFYGGTLSYDRRTNTTSNPTSYNDDVRLVGNGITLRYDLGQPTTSWITSIIDLVESAGWINTVTGLAPTQSQFQSVLADLTQLRLHADYRSGDETPSFDNITLTAAVPEPATAGLLVLVMGALARRR